MNLVSCLTIKCDTIDLLRICFLLKRQIWVMERSLPPTDIQYTSETGQVFWSHEGVKAVFILLLKCLTVGQLSDSVKFMAYKQKTRFKST